LALFPAFDELVLSPASGGEVRFTFTGDLFEMEDQRNWTDDSFKTYSTPLALPWPKDAVPGQSLRQSLTMTARGLAAGTAAVAGPPRLTVGPVLGRPLPPVGLGLTSQAGPLAPSDIERLRALRPAHLRVDL